MILVIGSEEEAHSKYMYDILCQKGYDVEYFDSRKYPEEIFINYTPNTIVGSLNINGKEIPLDTVQGVYWRWFYGVPYGNTEDGYLNNLIYRERNCALISLFQSLECNWVNSYKAIELHKTKIYQLNLMAKNNIRIPKTLITNEKEKLIEFYESNNKSIIYKPVLGGALTEQIKDTDLTDEKLETLKTSPIQLQEFIEGTDVRVYAMGDKIFAAEIRANTIDFRGDDAAEIVPIELPEKIQNDCRKILDILSLSYSGIDIRRNNGGEYIFIEANPAPMFIHFEKQTGYPITDSLVELLTR